VAQFADDLADLMTELRWEKALVAGASMGGCVALALAQRHPQRTAALGLIDTTAWYGEEAPAQWEERARKALQGGLASLVTSRLRAGSATPSARPSRSSPPRPSRCS
jgi:3-oxoadipate enol-lactonase